MTRFTSRKLLGLAVLAVVGMVGGLALAEGDGLPAAVVEVESARNMSRPMAPVVTPGTVSTPEQPGKAPSDAIILFDGTNLDQWSTLKGKEATFKLENGAMVADKEYVRTKQEFGDVQLHLEWMEPPPKGGSQGRGNSGVFFMGEFETQVLDNYKNPTYADGACGGIYGQYPPEVNACLPPETWQTYDLIFHRPRYEDGKLKEPAYITVIQNGLLVQDHHRIEGPTQHMHVASYPASMPEKGPIELQFHGNPVKYRNIWVRPLEGLEHQQETGEVTAAK